MKTTNYFEVSTTAQQQQRNYSNATAAQQQQRNYNNATEAQ